MEFSLKDCNNVDDGTIQVTNGKLNIKFGINGTGKSTIATAIRYSIESPELLKDLTPFKHRNQESGVEPSVTRSDDLSNILIFNEEYLNQFLFRENELLSNSFEVLIKTPEYKKSIEEIEKLLSDIKKIFEENEDLANTILDFENLARSFATTRTSLSKSSALFKGLKDGNLIEHIPESLKGYSKLIKHTNCVSWLAWQSKGEEFLEISDDCPYCTSPTEKNREAIGSVTKHYNKTVIKNFNAIIEVLKNLGKYFSSGASETLTKITEKQTGLEDSEMSYIFDVKTQIDNLLSKLKALQKISSVSFADDEKVDEKLSSLKIDIELFDRLKGDKTVSLVSSLNNSIDDILKKVGLLQGEINKQKRLVKGLIEKHKVSINSFLENAGYKYEVVIEADESQDYRLLLKHKESTETISGGKQHLSFGEKNAFALVLFMFEALRENPDLIILDDPISSFDKNKKYAIMHMLFRGKSSECFLNKTVLMLTHDLEPIIDTVKVLPEFGNLSESKFLSNKNGILNESEIKKDDLMSFAQICKHVLDSDAESIIKLIFLRRHYEILDDKGNEYEVLSNLFKKRTQLDCTDHRKPSVDEERQYEALSPDDFALGVNAIKEIFADFDYDQLLEKLTDDEFLRSIYEAAQNNYAKLNIFRLLFDEQDFRKLPNVLKKFILETYHIENELICQLDPERYELIPDFIIDECDKYVSAL